MQKTVHIIGAGISGLAAAVRLANANYKVHFQKSDEIMKRNSRRTVRAPRIMSKYYRAILDLLIERGFAAPRAPVRVTKMAKVAILLRYSII